MKPEEPVYDVIVIGAGLAGLSAARELKNKGLQYKVIEATKRPGGKVRSSVEADSSRYMELGAQFVNEDMVEMVHLIREAGMELERTYLPDDAIIINERKAEVGHIGFDHHAELLGDLAFKKKSPLSEVLKEVVEDEEEAKAIKSFVAAEFTVNSEYISPKALKRLIGNITLEEDEVKFQASGPLDKVIQFLAEESSDRIIYQAPVTDILKQKNNYVIKIGSQQSYFAKSVIVAVPPTVARRIRFSESLQERYQRALNSFIDGAVIKITLSYKEAFWRHFSIHGEEKTLFGVLFADQEGVNVMESSKVAGESRLTMFIGGDKAKTLSETSPEAREQFAVDCLTDILGKQAREYQDLVEKVWVESLYFGGGYGAVTHFAGDFEAKQVLKEPHENLVFASTELAPEFPQFMEGAVRSGKYAAKRLLNEEIS